MNNTASIVTTDGKRQLQLDVETSIDEGKRMEVLMTMALDLVAQVEKSVSEMSEEDLETFRLAYLEVEPAKDVTILGPDFAPAEQEVKNIIV